MACPGKVRVTTAMVRVTTDKVRVTTGKVLVTTGKVRVTTGKVRVTTGKVRVTTGKVRITTGKVRVTQFISHISRRQVINFFKLLGFSPVIMDDNLVKFYRESECVFRPQQGSPRGNGFHYTSLTRLRPQDVPRKQHSESGALHY